MKAPDRPQKGAIYQDQRVLANIRQHGPMGVRFPPAPPREKWPHAVVDDDLVIG